MFQLAAFQDTISIKLFLFAGKNETSVALFFYYLNLWRNKISRYSIFPKNYVSISEMIKRSDRAWLWKNLLSRNRQFRDETTVNTHSLIPFYKN